MDDTTDPDELERVLREHFAQHDQIPPLATDHAKALFGLRRLDDELIELTELAAVRDNEPDDQQASSLRFEFRHVTLLVISHPDSTEIHRSDQDINVNLENINGSQPLEFDPAGTASVQHAGPVRLRLELPDGTSGVTDPFTLPLQ